MVEEEVKEESRREAEHVFRFRRPDSSTHRHDVFVDEYLAVIIIVQKVTETNAVNVLVFGTIVYGRGCFAIKA